MKKIFIDQGHNPGTVNAGASANGLIESEVNYQVGIYLKQLLETNCNFEVMLSRNSPDTVLGTDTRTSLEERVNRKLNQYNNIDREELKLHIQKSKTR